MLQMPPDRLERVLRARLPASTNRREPSRSHEKETISCPTSKPFATLPCADGTARLSMPRRSAVDVSYLLGRALSQTTMAQAEVHGPSPLAERCRASTWRSLW